LFISFAPLWGGISASLQLAQKKQPVPILFRETKEKGSTNEALSPHGQTSRRTVPESAAPFVHSTHRLAVSLTGQKSICRKTGYTE
jgi:hypothetical protein